MDGGAKMAKDDMDVIIYKILRYMYECMKAGRRPALEDMCYNCKLFNIPERYWSSTMRELIDAGYVRGITYRMTKSGLLIDMMDDAAITLDGVHFLEENSGMAKAKQFLGNAFEIVLDTVLKM